MQGIASWNVMTRRFAGKFLATKRHKKLKQVLLILCLLCLFVAKIPAKVI
jgi:hypothetical protein